jgi:hypothetical protein
VATTCVPVWDRVPFCGLLAVTPAGRSKAIDQPLIAAAVELATTYLPPPADAVNVAVRPVVAAAWGASATAAPSVNRVAESSASLRMVLLRSRAAVLNSKVA